MSAFVADRWSPCGNGCEDGIKPGDEAVYPVLGDAQHVSCRPALALSNPVCRNCFTEKSVTGACLCEGD